MSRDANHTVRKPRQRGPYQKWGRAPFERAFDDLDRLMRMVLLSDRAIAVLPGFRKLANMISDDNPKEDPEARARRIESLKQEDELAHAERQSDFPTLHAFAVQSLWAILENLVRDFAATWIIHTPETRQNPSLSKLRIKLGEYDSLSAEERGLYLVTLLEQDMGSSFRLGINRFETLLSCINLSGTVDEACAKAIFELQQVRNLLAHRNGRVDRRIRTACPWLKLKIGQKLCVSSSQFARYHDACMRYAMELMYRVSDAYGQQLRKLSPQELIAHAEELDRRDTQRQMAAEVSLHAKTRKK